MECGSPAKPATRRMELLEARRLTGLNVIWDHACAVVDVILEAGDDADTLVANWSGNVFSMLEAVGWAGERITSHRFLGGVSLAVTAPIDCLYSAVELAEWAYAATDVTNEEAADFEAYKSKLLALIEEEKNHGCSRSKPMRQHITLPFSGMTMRSRLGWEPDP